MLAIACKKGGESTNPAGIFSVSQASGNVLTAIVQTNGKTFNSEVTILFSSDKSFNAALTSATTNGQNAMERLSYDANTGKITFPDSVITNDKLLITNGGGSNITYSLSFTVNADDTSLRNPSQTFNIDSVLQGTKIVDGEVFSNAMRNIAYTNLKTGETSTGQLTDFGQPEKYEATNATIKNAFSTSSGEVVTKITEFTNYVVRRTQSDSDFLKIFKSITFSEIVSPTAGTNDTDSAKLIITYDPQKAYQTTNDNKYQIEVKGGSSKWTNDTSN